MHKKLIGALALVFGLFFTEARAQKISVGPRLGVNFSKVDFSDGNPYLLALGETNQKSLAGAHVGVVAEIGISDKLFIQPELLFTQKGRRHEGVASSWGRPYKEKFRRDYLEIPILLKAKFGSENLHAFVNGGPYLAYLLGGKESYSSGGHEHRYDLDLEYNSISKPNRTDIGLALGGGIGSKIGPGNVALEVRYDLGFSDLNQYRQERNINFPLERNRTLGVSVSYLMPLQ